LRRIQEIPSLNGTGCLTSSERHFHGAWCRFRAVEDTDAASGQRGLEQDALLLTYRLLCDPPG
jgi:hypothetical protein